MSMTATEAKLLAAKTEFRADQRFVEFIEVRIMRAAERGFTSLDVTTFVKPIDYFQRRKLQKHFEGLGYEWREIEDQRENDWHLTIAWDKE